MINRKKIKNLSKYPFNNRNFHSVIYLFKNNLEQEKIISNSLQEKFEKQLQSKEAKDGNTFYNVKYSGLDLEVIDIQY